MNEVYFPEYSWELIKNYLIDWNKHTIYTKIRNKYGIANYMFVKKSKYQKRKNTKEYISNMIKNDENSVCFENYWYYGLIPFSNYIYIDEYIKLIPKYLKKTKKIIKRDKCIYYDIFNKDPLNYDKYPDFWHNGCFYVAMLYYGYEYKIRRNGIVDWNCEYVNM
jgi:hypothetical protein